VFAVGDSSAAARTRVDSLRALAGYEALWPVAGHRVSFLANNAWVLAKVMHEPEAIVRWAERIVAASPDAAEFVFGGLLENPATRAAGMDRLRGAVRRLDAVDHLRRPLESTVAQQHRADRAQAGRLLARLGQALLEDGLVASGRDTLVLAARSLWDPAVSTRLVHAFRQQGDTLAAARQLARIIVDPAAPAALRDSLARLEPGVDGVRWNRLVAEARQEMRAWVLEDAVMRTLPRVDAIITSGGAAQSLDHARRGRPAVVTFWSRFCGPSRQQMAELPRLAERLRAHGVELIAITTEEPSAELAKFLAESKVTIPVHHDRTRQAGRAFGQYATPEYHVVDADGRLRFTRSSLDQVVRQASVLVP